MTAIVPSVPAQPATPGQALRMARDRLAEPPADVELSVLRLLGEWADELDAAPAAPALYRRAAMGIYPMWMHTCGAVEAMTDEYRRNEVQGGCDACESGSDDPDDWRPLYLPVDPAAVEEAGPLSTAPPAGTETDHA